MGAPRPLASSPADSCERCFVFCLSRVDDKQRRASESRRASSEQPVGSQPAASERRARRLSGRSGRPFRRFLRPLSVLLAPGRCLGSGAATWLLGVRVWPPASARKAPGGAQKSGQRLGAASAQPAEWGALGATRWPLIGRLIVLRVAGSEFA